MGANDNLPNVPTFTAGSPTVASLNALSYATSFLIDHGTRPAWHYFLFTTQSLTASVWNTVTFDHVAYDSDNTYSSINHGANIKTQGYYEMEACVQLESGANKDDYNIAFYWSPNSGNPYFSHGVTQFGYAGNSMPQTGSAASDCSLTAYGISPYPAYPGDLFQVLVYPAAAHVVDINQNTSYIQGRFSTQFTGRWARSGS